MFFHTSPTTTALRPPESFFSPTTTALRRLLRSCFGSFWTCFHLIRFIKRLVGWILSGNSCWFGVHPFLDGFLVLRFTWSKFKLSGFGLLFLCGSVVHMVTANPTQPKRTDWLSLVQNANICKTQKRKYNKPYPTSCAKNICAVQLNQKEIKCQRRQNYMLKKYASTCKQEVSIATTI